MSKEIHKPSPKIMVQIICHTKAFFLFNMFLLILSGCREEFGPTSETKVRKVKSDFRLIKLNRLTTSTQYELPNLLDPFGQTYKIATVNNNVILYSIGPDQKSNLGILEYDPSNGSISNGDIVMSCAMVKSLSEG